MQNNEEALLPEVIFILEALLQQIEQPERQRVARVRLNARSHPWYFSGDELGLCNRIHEQLAYLVAKGWLKLNWKKHEQGNILESIDLVGTHHDTISDLYALLKRVPLQLQRMALMSMLEEQESHEAWFKLFLVWATQQIEEHKSPLPLSLSNLEMSRDLLLALSAIASLRQPTLERILSIELFGDSKRLEQLHGAVVSVLRTHASGTPLYGEDEWQLLRAHNIFRPPEYVPITGPLSLSLMDSSSIVPESRQLHLDASLPSIALSEDILRIATIVSCLATALVTVENLTSFSELLLARPASVITVFTGGFASPALISFLHRLRASCPLLPFFHWGDIDVGGLRILTHLRHHLKDVSPLCMDIATFKKHQRTAQILTSNDKLGMRALLVDNALEDCFLLINYLLESNKKLEQESIRVSYVLASLEKHF